MGLTSAQQQAVAARGNVLVVAGAGTGKTSTLVERCLGCLLEEKPRASLEELLMVTFTEAAAADMRRRIRERLQSELAKEEEKSEQPDRAMARHWQEQLVLFETAHIGTLHSFCLELARQHFYQLELDPQFSVLPEEEARLLAEESLDNLLQKYYAGGSEVAEAVQGLIQNQGGGSDRLIRTLVLRLHHYTQTLPDPAGWFAIQLEMFQSSEPLVWEQWLLEGLRDWRARWLPSLERDFPQNDLASRCAAVLRQLRKEPLLAEFAVALDAIASAAVECPQGKKTAWIKPLEPLLAEAEFLGSLTRQTGGGPPGPSPLTEDWGWVRSQMMTLLQLAREFTAAFSDAKHELGMVDFHDLEQSALRLLWDNQANRPTPIALQWRKKLRFVFVDEYQDINAAQDKIIEALCREGAQANRFLVGDVKQSIYRFRLANPRIFQAYLDTWHGDHGQTIALVENFRSREGVLQFINSLFGLVMQGEVAAVPYDTQAQLRFGAPAERRALSVDADAAPRVELMVRVKGGASANEGDEAGEDADTMDLEEADKEARLVALRLSELKAQQHPVWDGGTKKFRPVEWSDMAVLLRSPANKTESYAKEFSRLGLPLQVARGGFYESLEISDLLNLLRLLDNPLQDLPVLAVLRSPLVGLSLNELATIRLAVKGTFWTALVLWARGETQGPTPMNREQESKVQPRNHSGRAMGASQLTHRKVSAFLERYARWRRLARQASLSRCLDAVLSETHYADWLLTQPRGQQRHANVQRLVALARQFDQFQRQGLFRFLHFIEAQQMADTEPAVAPVSAGNSVRLMSIHQSKGLEFPVVVVADLAKPFNMADLRAEVILDEKYGLCPRITPPHTGQSYPSLPYWLARQRQTRELLGEELRLLYVAMTRARDTLLLSANVSESKFRKIWRRAEAPGAGALLTARSYADWVGLWFAQNAGAGDSSATQGATDTLRWRVQDDSRLSEPSALLPTDEETSDANSSLEPSVLQNLEQRLTWTYPFMAATRQPAKTSVSILRRLAAEQRDEESAPLFGELPSVGAIRKPAAPTEPPGLDHVSRFTHHASSLSPRPSAADIGSAHHAFLQFVSLDRTGSDEELRGEAQRLERDHFLTSDQTALLDIAGLAAFWESELGRQVRAQARFVRRELRFTARFSPRELAALTGESADPILEEEFIVVQGVADLAVLLPREIWLIDFKTDAVKSGGLAEKVKLYEPQLKLYGQALSRIYQRPLTAAWLYFLDCQTAVAVGE